MTKITLDGASRGTTVTDKRTDVLLNCIRNRKATLDIHTTIHFPEGYSLYNYNDNFDTNAFISLAPMHGVKYELLICNNEQKPTCIVSGRHAGEECDPIYYLGDMDITRDDTGKPKTINSITLHSLIEPDVLDDVRYFERKNKSVAFRNMAKLPTCHNIQAVLSSDPNHEATLSYTNGQYFLTYEEPAIATDNRIARPYWVSTRNDPKKTFELWHMLNDNNTIMYSIGCTLSEPWVKLNDVSLSGKCYIISHYELNDVGEINVTRRAEIDGVVYALTEIEVRETTVMVNSIEPAHSEIAATKQQSDIILEMVSSCYHDIKHPVEDFGKFAHITFRKFKGTPINQQ